MDNRDEWNDVKVIKPEHNTDCWVYNCRWGNGFRCTYNKTYDVFQLYDPRAYDTICIDVTHWIKLPSSKNDKCFLDKR